MADPTPNLKDAAYAAVGFGVLAFQRAQVRRRELEKTLEQHREAVREQVWRVASEIEEHVDPALDHLEGRLPPPAQGLLRQARSVARDLRSRLAG